MTAADVRAGPFPRKLTALLATIGALCLVGSFVAMFVTRGNTTTACADTTSSSALGHRAFLDLLRAEGVPVVVSRHATAGRTAGASLLLLIEPMTSEIGRSGTDLGSLIRAAKCPVLLVLPKWRPIESIGRERRLVEVVRLSEDEVNSVVTAAEPSARAFTAEPGTTSWSTNVLGAEPEIAAPQVVTTKDFEPLIAGAKGFLAADGIGGRFLAILADPDLIANHGLHRGANARIALDLVARLRSGRGPVVIDETLHGLSVPESFWAQLFQFPLVLATIQAALAVFLLVSSGIRRFGAPENAPPAFEPGTRFLVDHTAKLLESGRHHGEAVSRYAALAIEDAIRGTHAEAGRRDDVRASLAKLEARRFTSETLSELEEEAARLARSKPRDARAALRVARRFRRWKQEMVDGSHGRSGVRS